MTRADPPAANPRVLLLDADTTFRARLEAALREQRFESHHAATVAEAGRALSQMAFDLVLVDGSLPDDAGMRFIGELRARDAAVRIVLVSAGRTDLKTFRTLTRDLDVSLVLDKPVAIDKVGQQLARIILSKPNSQADNERVLANLRRQFSAKLPAKLQELETSLVRARNDSRQLERARVLAHRLRGSIGTYGYTDLGEAVGWTDDLLADVELETDPSQHWRKIDNAMRETRMRLESALELEPVSDGSGAGRRRLLVVDDDPHLLRMVRRAARRLSVQAVTATTAEQALARSRGLRLAGAVFGISSEQSLGLAHQLRAMPGNAEIPVAFCSLERDIETRLAAIEAGGTHFFDKPISDEGLSMLVNQMVAAGEVHQGRVLVVDDDPDVVSHYSAVLGAAGIRVEALYSAKSIVETLEEKQPDVLLLDVQLPDISGLDVCRALRISDKFELLPILMVTAQTDDQTRLRAFRAGASDVVAKPVIAEELMARVSVQLDRVRLQRDRADKDSLTNLLLRRSLVEALQRSLATADRNDTPLSLVLLDIDFFKKVNDTYGHLTGDQVLASMGDLLRRRFRKEDLRGRWGGEEFMLAFPGADAAFATVAAQRLLVDFSALRFTAEDGQVFSATFTAGVAAYPEDGTSVSSLVRCADERLYAGKEGGRNQVIAGESARAPRTHHTPRAATPTEAPHHGVER